MQVPATGAVSEDDSAIDEDAQASHEAFHTLRVNENQRG